MLRAIAALSGTNRGVGITQGGKSQCDAVGDSEGADRLNEHPAVLDDQKDAEKKEGMVRAERNVANSVNNLATHDSQAALRVGNFDIRLRRMNDRGPRATVEKLDANENVGDGELQSGKLDALARQTVWPASSHRRSTKESASS
jgi:hypothetical protein